MNNVILEISGSNIKFPNKIFNLNINFLPLCDHCSIFILYESTYDIYTSACSIIHFCLLYTE